MRLIFKKVNSVVVLCILFSLLMPFPLFGQDFITQERKESTLKCIKEVKDSVGIKESDKKKTFPSKRRGIEIEEKIKEIKEDVRKIEQSKVATSQEGKVSSGSNKIKVKYTGTSEKELYPTEEKKGPTTLTILNPYHPEHEGFKVPYYKDREGLKIHPWIGIRGEYKQDEKLVPIQSLIQEAKEFYLETDKELRKYISTNDKHYSREELLIHIKETLPKFTFIHHNERTTRVYEGKKIWSSNKVLYDNNDKKYYKLEYTIPNLTLIGYLKLTGRYGNIRHYEPNNNLGYRSYDSYRLTFESMPFFDTKLKMEIEYQNGDKLRDPNVNSWDRYKYFVELTKKFPRCFLTIKPYYKHKDEEFYPVKGTDLWREHKAGVKIEKVINGELEFNSNWEYRYLERDKLRKTANSDHISLKSLVVENELKYEIVKDLKACFGLDYGTGFSYDGFNYYTVRGEISYRKPGLADYRLGVRHTEYYNIEDSLDTVYFKIGFFM